MKLKIFRLFQINLLLASLVWPGASVIADDSSILRLTVYGATGRVGSRVTQEALSRGHLVTAVSRKPGKIKNRHRNLTPVQGDILDPESVAALISDQDIVVVSVRGNIDKSGDPDKTVHRMAAPIIVNHLRSLGAGAPRLIFVGGAGSLEIEPGVIYADRLPSFIPDFIEQEIQGHLSVLKYLRGVDDVRWTYISPAIKFSPGSYTGRYRIGGDQALRDSKGKNRISMEDYAVALVDEAESGSAIGKRISVAY